MREWKINEDGHRYLISKDEHRDIFMLRRKKLTFRAIGEMYQVTGSHIRTLVAQYQRRRKLKVFRYLKLREERSL